MMIIGIIVAILGLALFMVGGALMNNTPGIQKSHAVVFGLGFAFLIVGLILTVKAAV